MAAGINDYFTHVGTPGSATALAAPGHTIGGTSFTVDTTALMSTDTAIIFAIDVVTIVNGAEVRTAGTYTVWRGLVTSGTAITSCVLMYGTDQNYSAGSTTRVYVIPTTSRENRLVDGLLIEHAQAGTHTAALITSRTEDTAPDVGADYLLSYDASATALKKVKPSNLGLTTGWVAGQLPAVSSVTNNGNRSADVVFASTVASLLTPGMRVRGSRTVAAPTGAATFNGTSQYLSKASPAGMGATDDITVMGWIKPTAYQAGGLASRNNGTTDGWLCNLNASGQIVIQGARAADDVATSYQSVALNKWVHVAATLDSSGAASTMYLDGVSIPVSYTNNANSAFLAPTQSFLIGATNGASPTNFFKGEMVQMSVYSAVLSQATIRAAANQTLTGSETSEISAYKLDQASGLTDLNANANNLTNNGTVTYSVDSPFSLDANGVPGGTYEWGIVTKVATTTATIQFPEGSCFPTTGGVSTVDLSTQKVPFGFPALGSRWEIVMSNKTNGTQSAPTISQWYNLTPTSGTSGGHVLTIPTGDWIVSYQVSAGVTGNGGANSIFITLSTANNTQSDPEWTLRSYLGTVSTLALYPFYRQRPLVLTSATPYYLNTMSDLATTQFTSYGANGPTLITAIPSYL